MLSDKDLKSMSSKDLEALRDRVDAAISVVRSEERKRALLEVQSVAAKFGFTLDELTGQPQQKKRASPVPKYRNPETPSQTWSGMGRKPSWVREALENGRDLEQLRI